MRNLDVHLLALPNGSFNCRRAGVLIVADHRWQRHLDGAIRGGASSDGTTIFVASQGGEVAAFALEGKELWRTRVKYTTETRPNWSPNFQDAQIYPAPTVAGDVLVVGYRRNNEAGPDPALVALDLRTGAVWWPTGVPKIVGTGEWGNVRSSAAYFNGLLIHAEAYSNRVVAQAVEDGHVVWSTECGVCQFSHWPSPAIAGGLVFIPRNDGGLYALEAKTGALQWSLYLGDSDLAGLTFPADLLPDPENPCAWQTRIGKPIYASPAVARNGNVIVGTDEGYLFCIGDKRW